MAGQTLPAEEDTGIEVVEMKAQNVMQFTPANAVPQRPLLRAANSVEMQPANAPAAMPLQPMNATSVQPLNATPMNATPMNATPMNATPMNATPLQPMNATPLQPMNATPMQSMNAGSPAQVRSQASVRFAAGSDDAAPPRPPKGADGADGADGGAVPRGAVPPRSTVRRQQTHEEVKEHLDVMRKRLSDTGQISAVDLTQMMKEEKVRLAMEKMAAASNVSLIVKLYMDKHRFKTLAVESVQTAQEVCQKFVLKNRLEDNPNWAIVEENTAHHVLRVLEDHEMVGDVIGMWPATEDNRLLFQSVDRKYELFTRPELYFPPHMREDLAEAGSVSERTERAKRILLQEYVLLGTTHPSCSGAASTTFRQTRSLSPLQPQSTDSACMYYCALVAAT